MNDIRALRQRPHRGVRHFLLSLCVLACGLVGGAVELLALQRARWRQWRAHHRVAGLR